MGKSAGIFFFAFLRRGNSVVSMTPKCYRNNNNKILKEEEEKKMTQFKSQRDFQDDNDDGRIQTNVHIQCHKFTCTLHWSSKIVYAFGGTFCCFQFIFMWHSYRTNRYLFSTYTFTPNPNLCKNRPNDKHQTRAANCRLWFFNIW